MFPTSSLFTEHPFSGDSDVQQVSLCPKVQGIIYYGMYSASSLNIYVKVPLSVFLNVTVFRKKILKEMIKFKQAANIQIILVQ